MGAWLVFIAFGIKCAFPLLHNWLPDAYPNATATGAVFLCVYNEVGGARLPVGSPAKRYCYIGAAMALVPSSTPRSK